MKQSMHLMAPMAALALLAAPAAAGQSSPAAPPATAADPEEQLDEGLKGFGYLAGLARVCVATGQQIELDREVLDLHTAIGRLLGTDRAFLFSTSFGYGTSVKVETKDCAEVLKNYEARVIKFRASNGRGQ